MTQAPQVEMDRWRMIILNRDASEVLAESTGGEHRLPEVAVPRHQRLAWHLNAEMKSSWNLNAVSILPLECEPSDAIGSRIEYHIAELHPAPALLPITLRWINIPDFEGNPKVPAEHRSALRRFPETLAHPVNKGTPFGRLGWFDDVASWVRETIAPLSLEWAGLFEQFQACACFSLIRFETSPRSVWFKAVGDPNTREFSITQKLASLHTDCAPRLLAVRPEWNAWLAEDCSGQVLNEIAEPELWRMASRTLAQLQIASSTQTGDLLRAGAHNLPTIFSDAAIDRFFASAAILLGQDSELVERGIAAADFGMTNAAVREALAKLEVCRIPEALGHLDLNAGNAVVTRERCVYLDWAEAYVGPPLLTLEYLLQSFRRKFGRGSPEEPSVVDAYLDAWICVAPREAIRDAWAVAPALAVFAYAHRCLTAVEASGMQNPRFTNYLASLLRRLKRELSAISEGKLGATA
jgi:hypothetical protein